MENVEAIAPDDERLRAVLTHLSQSVTLIQPDGRFVTASGLVRDAMGYPDGFWDDHDAWELIHPDDLATVLERHQELLSRPGHRVQAEFRARRADGEYLHIEAVGTNLMEDPTVGGILLSMRDVTDRKRVEADLACARDEAIRALNMRGEFIASVSHELRNPIHGILGLTELLSSSEEVGPLAADLVRGVSRAADTLRVVLDDVIDFSVVESGRFRLEPGPVEVAALMGELGDLFGSEAHDRGLQLQTIVAGGTPRLVQADPDRLRQVLSNLIVNALKFTRTGHVVVAAEKVTTDDGAEVRFTVTDTGIGITPDALERIFEPFHQERLESAAEKHGTGLGLAIARRLTELMGGGMGVQSTPGVGSEFWVRLPSAPTTEPEPSPNLPAPPVNGQQVEPFEAPTPISAVPRGEVLIVEDDAVARLLLSRQLEKLGRRVVACSTGAAALDLLGESVVSPLAAVLVDCRLPDIEGVAVARRIRSLEQSSGVPATVVIGLTGDSAEAVRDDCLAAGMDEVLVKPVSLGEVSRLFNSPRSTNSASPLVSESSWEPSKLEDLSQELGDPGVSVRIVDAYLTHLSERIEALEAAAVERDERSLVALGHLLGSTSETVGAVQLARWSRAIKERAEAVGADDHTVRCLVASLSVEARRVRSALGSWRERQLSVPS